MPEPLANLVLARQVYIPIRENVVRSVPATVEDEYMPGCMREKITFVSRVYTAIDSLLPPQVPLTQSL